MLLHAIISYSIQLSSLHSNNISSTKVQNLLIYSFTSTTEDVLECLTDCFKQHVPVPLCWGFLSCYCNVLSSVWFLFVFLMFIIISY